MSPTARALRLVVAIAVFAGLVLTSTPEAAAGTPEAAAELLQRSRELAASGSFSGVVEVRWHDDSGRERGARVRARSVEGAFVIGVGDHQVLGHGDERITSREDERTRWSAASPELDAPEPGSSWELDVAGRREIAGRDAFVVTASDDGGAVRARFAVDRETGLLLERAVLDERQQARHVVRFVSVVTGESALPAPRVRRGDEIGAPEQIAEVPEGFLAVQEVGEGYRLLGRYRHPDGSVQLYYSDGLFTLSVFQARGRVDWDALAPGTPVGNEGLRARSFSTAAGTAVVWGHSGVVRTVVGDGPPDAVLAVVADLSDERGDGGSFVDDVADFVIGPFGWE